MVLKEWRSSEELGGFGKEPLRAGAGGTVEAALELRWGVSHFVKNAGEVGARFIVPKGMGMDVGTAEHGLEPDDVDRGDRQCDAEPEENVEGEMHGG